jgi:hypothetical protein
MPTQLQRLNLMVRLNRHVPASLKPKLCFTCGLFVHKVVKTGKGWGGRLGELDGKAVVTGRQAIKGPRCPYCVEAKEIDGAELSHLHNKFVKLAKKAVSTK